MSLLGYKRLEEGGKTKTHRSVLLPVLDVIRLAYSEGPSSVNEGS
jgi:hypothetical protein